MNRTTAILAEMPKIELHVHLESTIDGKKLQRYAENQGKTMPRSGNDIYNCSAEDLSNFLAFLDLICSFVGSTEDLEEIAYDFSVRSAGEHILYAETILNPTHWPQFTVPEIISALTRGFDRGAADKGTDCRFTLSLSRDQSAEEAVALLNMMKAHRTHRLAGLSIDGNEALSGRTGQRFSPVFRQAREAGFGVTVHAGESSGPEGVLDALDLLCADRLDHGVRAWEDKELTQRLVEEKVPLNICLSSNLALLYHDPGQHPLRQLWDAGTAITLNRDDPTFLGGLTLTEELERCAAFAAFSPRDLLQAQYHAAEAAFCKEATRSDLISQLNRYAQAI